MRARRTDENQGDIVKALRAIGCTVAITSGVGNGFPDLVAGRNKRTYMLEVKDGDKCESARQLTAEEAIFHNEWKGHLAIVTNVKEALAAVGAVVQ